MTDTERAFAILRKSRDQLTRQQYKTLCGQAKAGDADAAIRGLEKILKRNKREDTA